MIDAIWVQLGLAYKTEPRTTRGQKKVTREINWIDHWQINWQAQEMAEKLRWSIVKPQVKFATQINPRQQQTEPGMPFPWIACVSNSNFSYSSSFDTIWRADAILSRQKLRSSRIFFGATPNQAHKLVDSHNKQILQPSTNYYYYYY